MLYAILYAQGMRAISYSDLRKNLAKELDQVTEDHEPVIITRGSGKASAVLMSLEDFGSYEETAYLMRSPKNARRLLKSVEELDSGRGTTRQLIE